MKGIEIHDEGDMYRVEFNFRPEISVVKHRDLSAGINSDDDNFHQKEKQTVLAEALTMQFNYFEKDFGVKFISTKDYKSLHKQLKEKQDLIKQKNHRIRQLESKLADFGYTYYTP